MLMMKLSNTLACWEYGLIKRYLNTFTFLFCFYVLHMSSQVGPNLYLCTFSMSVLLEPQDCEMLFHYLSFSVCVSFFLFTGFCASGNCFSTENSTLTQYLTGSHCMALVLRCEGIILQSTATRSTWL